MCRTYIRKHKISLRSIFKRKIKEIRRETARMDFEKLFEIVKTQVYRTLEMPIMMSYKIDWKIEKDNVKTESFNAGCDRIRYHYSLYRIYIYIYNSFPFFFPIVFSLSSYHCGAGRLNVMNKSEVTIMCPDEREETAHIRGGKSLSYNTRVLGGVSRFTAVYVLS